MQTHDVPFVSLYGMSLLQPNVNGTNGATLSVYLSIFFILNKHNGKREPKKKRRRIELVRTFVFDEFFIVFNVYDTHRRSLSYFFFLYYAHTVCVRIGASHRMATAIGASTTKIAPLSGTQKSAEYSSSIVVQHAFAFFLSCAYQVVGCSCITGTGCVATHTHEY